MKKIVFIALFALLSLPVKAQNLEYVLGQIEQNNSTIKALSDQTEADKVSNRTGTSLAAPEVEFGYLWGAPSGIGNRTDISVSQEFDIATISGMRSRQSRQRNELIDLQFASERTRIMLEAKLYAIELIYYNRLAIELSTRLQHAETIADGYALKMDNGEANRLEYNKALLNLSTIKSQISQNDIERKARLAELRRLNGGVELFFDDTEFPAVALPADFDSWYDEVQVRNPLLEYLRQDVELNRQQVSIARIEGLPSLSVGYMRESIQGQYHQGITLGMSIPLWSSRKNVKQAQTSFVASQTREQDLRLQFYEQLQNLHQRALGLSVIAAEYRHIMEQLDNTELLKKALDAGEISLLDYIVEMGLYYDTTTSALESELNFHIAYATLLAIEL